MNLYGVVTGTDDYALNVSLPPGFQLCIGDTITINPINANTGAATLSVGGMSPLPLTLNGAALTAGQLEAGKDRQCTFKGSGFACDNAGGSGGASFVGTSSNLTLGDGSAGIVPAGNFGNLSASDITAAGGALESTRAAADTALAAPSYVTLATSATLANERVLTGTSNQITLTDNGAGGTLVLSTPQNIHTGASPTFAGETLTGPLQLSGTQSNAGNTITNIFRGSSGEATVNSAWLNLNWNGVNYHTIGSTGWQLVSGTTGAGNSVANIFRNSGGGITYNAPTGGTHIATVNGVRAGGFPLVPGDMPHRLAIFRRITSDQAYAGSFAVVPVDYNQEAQDDGGDVSISSGTITFANTGRYRVLANFYTTTAAYLILPILNYTSGSSNFIEALDFTRTDGTGTFFGQTSFVYDVTAGDTLKILVQAGTGGDLKYANGSSVAAGKANWVQIERLK